MKFLVTIAAACFATSLSAATLTVETISGTFDNSTTTDGSAVTGEGTSAISWGDPATNDGQSGYTFVSEATPFSPLSSPFDIGTFTHLNYPVFAPTLTGTELTVALTGNVDGVSFSTFSTYSLAHTETTNSSPCFPGSVSICDDIVTLGAATAVGDSITVDGVEYFLEISGFDGGLNFFTQEGQSNSATLMAGFTTRNIVAPVPLPAAAWMLLVGLGGLFGLKRRNKSVV